MRAVLFSLSLLVGLVACESSEPVSAPTPDHAPTPAVDPAPEAPAEAPIAEAPKLPTLDLNTATEEAFLAGVPELGKKMAHEFEEYRPYVSIAQFRKEMGKYVDEAKIAEYERYVYVPVDVNAADAATLQQLPGVSAEEAEALMAKRPFADEAAFLAALGEAAEPAEVEAGKGLLKR